MSSVADILEQMKSKFNADAAAGMENVFQFQVEDGDSFYVAINDGNFDVQKGEHDDPSVTMIMDTETLLGVMTGELDGMQAFMGGKLRVEGDMMLGLKLGELFPV